MRRSTVAAIAAALALALAGCPLPQPLPSYPAGTITPPRILSDTTTAGVNSFTPVPAGCPTAPAYALDARIFYQESVTLAARWFVDYRTDVQSRYTVQNAVQEVPPDPNALILERQVPTFVFQPYGYPVPPELAGSAAGPTAPGVVHVVELVVSNGFATAPGDAAQPNRTPATTPDGLSQFEIQTYRWIFVNVPESTGCNAGDPGCVRCPT
jgi:hypothetical protein